MTDRASRHFSEPTYRYPLDDSDVSGVELYQPRVPSVLPGVLSHRVEAGDRLDLLASRYLGNGHLSWRIVDANPGIAMEVLLEPGRVLAIPEPD